MKKAAGLQTSLVESVKQWGRKCVRVCVCVQVRDRGLPCPLYSMDGDFKLLPSVVLSNECDSNRSS